MFLYEVVTRKRKHALIILDKYKFIGIDVPTIKTRIKREEYQYLLDLIKYKKYDEAKKSMDILNFDKSKTLPLYILLRIEIPMWKRLVPYSMFETIKSIRLIPRGSIKSITNLERDRRVTKRNLNSLKKFEDFIYDYIILNYSMPKHDSSVFNSNMLEEDLLWLASKYYDCFRPINNLDLENER